MFKGKEKGENEDTEETRSKAVGELEKELDEGKGEGKKDKGEKAEVEGGGTEGGMVSMKRTWEEKKEHEMPTASEMEDYDYGLRVELNGDNLEKLGLDKLPNVGDTMTLEAKVEVSNVSQSARKSGENKSMSLQITDMKLEA